MLRSLRINGFSFALSRCKKKHSNSVSFRWREKKYLWLTHCILAFNITFHLFPCFAECKPSAELRSHLNMTPTFLLDAIKAQAFDLTMNKIQKCFVIHSVEWAPPLSSLNGTLFTLLFYRMYVRQRAGRKRWSCLCLRTYFNHSHQYYSFTLLATYIVLPHLLSYVWLQVGYAHMLLAW